jgi:hypothetical protein
MRHRAFWRGFEVGSVLAAVWYERVSVMKAKDNLFYREPASLIYDLSVTRDGPLISIAEDWRGEQFITRIFDTRDGAVRDKLIELGWTPPEGREAIHRAGYRSGFYSAGNYFPDQAWRRYEDRNRT